MSSNTVRTKASAAAIRAALAVLPQIGHHQQVGEALLKAVGIAALRKIKEAFVVKMRGGTDESGLRWAPLSPLTVALRGKRRRIDILRDTGLLLRSLSPTSAVEEKVFRVEPGSVTIGTRRQRARTHHEGTNRRAPQRRLWPEPRNWPGSWWEAVVREIVPALVRATLQIVRSTP